MALPIKNYENIPSCSEKEKQEVISLFNDINNHGYLYLMSHAVDFYTRSKQIEKIHPLRFLICLFSNTTITSSMKEISKSLKWCAISKGFQSNFDKYSDLHLYLNPFAKEMVLTPNKMEKYFKEKNWPGLVEYLIDKKG
jgi:hypothetical protein